MHVRAQSCPILCDPIDYSLPDSSVHGILQARILEWIAIPPPGDLPNPDIEPVSPALQADSLLSEPLGKSSLKLSVQKTKIMASSLITSWQIDGETVTEFIFLGS